MKTYTLTTEEAWRRGIVKLENVATWKAMDLMNFCIENDLYTGGDSQHYNAMLDFVRENKCTVRAVELVATDIVAHSYTGNGDIMLSLYPSPYHCQSDVDFMFDEIVENVLKFE